MSEESNIDVKEVAEFISKDMNKTGVEILPVGSEIYSMEKLKKVV